MSRTCTCVKLGLAANNITCRYTADEPHDQRNLKYRDKLTILPHRGVRGNDSPMKEVGLNANLSKIAVIKRLDQEPKKRGVDCTTSSSGLP